MTVESLSQQVDAQRGTPGGWPSDLTYLANETAEGVETIVGEAGLTKGGVWKRIDPWGLAFFHEVEKIAGKTPRLKFSVRSPNTPMER